LFIDFIAIVKGVKHCTICLDTVPSFSSSGILDKIEPIISCGDLIMVLSVPFGIWETCLYAIFTKDI
jgi:hypothetical protein